MPFKNQRPETRATPSSAAARDFYSDKESKAYTTTANVSIQKDLTRHALELLLESNAHSIVKDESLFLLDIGAGSGISTLAAQNWLKERNRTAYTLAFDISKSMLSLVFKKAYINVDFYCGDAAQNLPIRDGLMDIAIGISMLQWLRPRELKVCFSSLLKQLAPERDTGAIFQLYPSSVSYVDTMEKVALRVGFDRAEMFVSFPHSTAAKKWFFCVEKLKGSEVVNEDEKSSEKQELCLFARHYDRRCVLQWLGDRRKYAKEIRERVVKEHVKMAWHIWRKFRRSIIDDESTARPSKIPSKIHVKAQQSLKLYPSDKIIGQALQDHFKKKAEKISFAMLLEHADEVVDVLHTAYTEARKKELG
ncbi:hypothetical protein PsorP6_018257 [Peronosclerospora sorghi]|uniref:Uncharacterized protein n=1 Tax=Peronosclerospora sorghi TaxID=230839 RepID=A0ACC0WDR4_9STRA|nr:hypothetical protein PsorP6_018257 [Peronosclerospora sorghi]